MFNSLCYNQDERCSVWHSAVATIVLLIGFASLACAQTIRSEIAKDTMSNLQPRSTPYADSIRIIEQIDELAQNLYHSDPDSALKVLVTAMDQSIRFGFRTGVYKSALALGVVHTERGNYNKADSLNQFTYKFCKDMGEHYLINWHNNMGQLRVYQGRYDDAYRHFDSAMSEIVRNGLQQTSMASMIYGNAGSLFKIIEEPAKAIYYCKKSLDIAIQLNDSIRTCAAYNNLGSAFVQMGAYQKAIECFKNVIPLARRIRKYSSLQIAYVNLGELYWITNNIDLAVKYLQSAIHLTGQQNPYHSIATPALYLSQIYLLQNDYENARRYAEQAMQASNSIRAQGILPPVYMVLSKVDFQEGRYKDAYLNLSTYLRYLDSNMNLERQKTIHQLETAYRTAEKDNEIMAKKLLLADQERAIQSRNVLIGLISIGVILIGTVLFLVFRYRNKMERVKRINDQKDREIMRYKSIVEGEERERTRLANELHDGIISQLTAVKVRMSSLLHQEGPIDKDLFLEGYQYLEQTMKDLRMTAHNLTPETVDRRGLVGALQEFCKKLENDNVTRIHLITNDERPLSKDIELSIYRIVQELVQNALKHASAKSLIVQIHFLDSLLSITVEDDGVGFNPCDNWNGLGLENVKERVAVMDGQIQIESQKGAGTTIYLEIPIENSISLLNVRHDNSSDHR